jgi:hypothetical protein
MKRRPELAARPALGEGERRDVFAARHRIARLALAERLDHSRTRPEEDARANEGGMMTARAIVS